MGWRYQGGLFSIFMVVILWVTTSEVTQGVYTDYRQPFVVAYLGTSLLVVYLPIALTKDWLLHILRFCSTSRNNIDEETVNKSSEGVDSTISNVKCNGACKKLEIEQQEPLANPSYAVDIQSQVEGKPLISEFKDDMHTLKLDRKLTTKEIAVIGFRIAPLWFATEYLTNAALARTTVASTTLLSSTSGLFTLFFSSFLGQDSINVIKVISVVISMSGVAVTTLGKSWAADESQWSTVINEKHSLVGDLFAVLSAMTYGLFSVLVKRYGGEDGDRVDLQKFFGFVGFFTLVSLWWLVWPLTAIGVEPKLKLPPTVKINEIILINGFAGSVLCDYFWALGIVWTTPLVAALGASLTIPLAMLEDMVIHGQHYSAIYILGSSQVFLGFVIANLSDWLSQKLGW